MKRAKVMLTAIAVLAVVGGALAFKANNKFNKTYCVLTTDGTTGGSCTSEIANSKFFVAPASNQVTWYYTTKLAGDACTAKQCTVSTSFITD